MTKKLFLLSITLIGVFSACKKEDVCKTTDVTYTNTVKSILTASCTNCHNSATSGNLTTYADTKTFVGWGRTMGSIRHDSTYSAMPKGGSKLSDCQISQMQAWIDAGMPE